MLADADAAAHHQREVGGDDAVQHVLDDREARVPSGGTRSCGRGAEPGRDRVNGDAGHGALPGGVEFGFGEGERGGEQVFVGDRVNGARHALSRYRDEPDVLEQSPCDQIGHPRVHTGVGMDPKFLPQGVAVDVRPENLDEVRGGNPACLLMKSGLTAHDQGDADRHGSAEHVLASCGCDGVHGLLIPC